MNMDESMKEKYLKLFEKMEGAETQSAIKNQVQSVTRELSTLLGMLESGLQLYEPDSKEYIFLNSAEFKDARERGVEFLNTLIQVARNNNIQLQ